jgi:hypothetical protein
MKLHEIQHLASMVDTETTVTIVRGGTEFVLNSDWRVVIEAPDGHPYELHKEPWTAKDLVEFMVRYPLADDDCMMVFLYNVPDDCDTLALVPTEVAIYLDNGTYELEFSAL